MKRNLMGGIVVLLSLWVSLGCSPVPRKYLRDATPKVTLAALTAAPDVYRNRLVVMGAVILEEQSQAGALWLHVKNRPLDQDYRPQLPPSVDHAEGGWYWVVVDDQRSFPPRTVIGRI